QAVGSSAAGQAHFAVAGSQTQLWEIHYSGSFVGNVTVTLHFDPALIDPAYLSQLYVEHYVNGQWVIPSNQHLDTTTDTITFTTDSFSPFVLAETPEPASIVLLASALPILILRRWLRRR